MKLPAGKVFSISDDMPPVSGCTTSQTIHHANGLSITNFSLAAHTDISAECYDYHKLFVVEWGDMEVYQGSADPTGLAGPAGFAGQDGSTDFAGPNDPARHHVRGPARALAVASGEAVVSFPDVALGVRTDAGCVYTEVTLKKEAAMNDTLKSGEVVKLADLLPYQDGRVVNMDLARNDGMKLALMSFGAGTGLDEHSAPGEALVFALDGEGVIGYEGQEHVIHAGENFKFDKGGRHFVRADRPFKMALLLTL